MSSKNHIQRKRELDRLDRESYLKQRSEHIASYRAENLTSEEAFFRVTKRIEWLNDKILWCKINDKKHELYDRERESLFWMMDKIKELSEKLLRMEEIRYD